VAAEALFSVPFPKHPHFFGREQELAQLHASLEEARQIGINPASLGEPTGLVGQGGIGKTQLAVEYCYRYQDDYPDGVLWLNAANELRAEFARLGETLQQRAGQWGENKASAFQLRVEERQKLVEILA
jgi:hypothetical protein